MLHKGSDGTVCKIALAVCHGCTFSLTGSSELLSTPKPRQRPIKSSQRHMPSLARNLQHQTIRKSQSRFKLKLRKRQANSFRVLQHQAFMRHQQLEQKGWGQVLYCNILRGRGYQLGIQIS